MASESLKLCGFGCPNFRPCPVHSRQNEAGRANRAIRRLYHTKRWYAYRDQKRAEQPFCPHCEREGLLIPWDDLDHDPPHGNDPVAFWDYARLVGLCKRHHTMKTTRESRGI